MTFLSIFLQADGGGVGSLGFLVLMIVVMYFFFFRPQMKRQKEDKKFREAIAKGQRVVTTSGIHGKILEVKDNTVVIESENTRLKFERTAISKEMSKQYMPKEEKETKEVKELKNSKDSKNKKEEK
jgi:preprotein translocase subunit YajC